VDVSPSAVLKYPDGKRYTKQIEGFADAIRNGKELMMPLEDTLRNMKLIIRLYEDTKR